MYLLLSILASTLIFIIFTLVGKYKINTLQTIVFNYFTAFSLGVISYSQPLNTYEIIQSKWFYGAIGLGVLFISIFNVMALTAQTIYVKTLYVVEAGTVYSSGWSYENIV